MVTAHPREAPEDSPAAPAAHMPGATGTSGALLASFAPEGCVSSCHIVDGFGFFFRVSRGGSRCRSPGADYPEETGGSTSECCG